MDMACCAVLCRDPGLRTLAYSLPNLCRHRVRTLTLHLCRIVAAMLASISLSVGITYCPIAKLRVASQPLTVQRRPLLTRRSTQSAFVGQRLPELARCHRRAMNASGRRAGVSVKAETSYVMIKPDGVQRALVGEIIHRFERKGFTLKALKMFVPSKELAEEHYKDLSSKPFFPKLVEYIISGPVVAMVGQADALLSKHLWSLQLRTLTRKVSNVCTGLAGRWSCQISSQADWCNQSFGG